MAGRRALKAVFGVEPDLTREGGSISVTMTFLEATGKNMTLLPVGQQMMVLILRMKSSTGITI